jgi:hypothetical protein
MVLAAVVAVQLAVTQVHPLELVELVHLRFLLMV